MANYRYRLNEIVVRNQATHDMAERLEQDITAYCISRLEQEFTGHKFRVHIGYDSDGETECLELIGTMSVIVDAIDGLLYLMDGAACSMGYDAAHKNIITVEKRPIPIEKLEQFMIVLSTETGIKVSMRADDVKRYYDSVIRAKE